MATMTYQKRVLILVLITAAVVLALLGVKYFADVLLLVFASILIAVGWRGLAALISSYTPLSINAAVASLIVLSLVGAVGVSWWIVPTLLTGLEDLFARLPDALEQVESAVQSLPVGDDTLGQVAKSVEPDSLAVGMLDRLDRVFSSALKLISGSLGGLVAIFVVLVLAIYFAVKPAVYLDGALRLLPPSKRQHMGDVAGILAHGLRWWLVGRIASMAVTGVLTWIGLMFLDIPSALTLGVIAGLLSFIPNIGPVLSAVPAVLVGLGQSPQLALYVALVYILVQLVESYAITPLIEQRVITLPPALTITAQLLFGVALGFLGLMLATPLVLVVVLLVENLYLKDVHGEKVHEI
jgi:predicted PurR-regulated permease PerM